MDKKELAKAIVKKAKTKTQILTETRKRYRDVVASAFTDEDVLITSASQIAFPIVLENGDESYIVITVKIPRKEYDPYTESEEYLSKEKDQSNG